MSTFCVRRSDFDRVKSAIEAAEFKHKCLMDVDCFLEFPDGGPRDAVPLVYAGERVRANHPDVAADVVESEDADEFRILNLHALVRMKLNAFRDKDRVHLRDLIDVGLIDESWCLRLIDEHAQRLRQLLEAPDG